VVESDLIDSRGEEFAQFLQFSFDFIGRLDTLESELDRDDSPDFLDVLGLDRFRF
jgi:hypothetical protein